MRQTALDVEGGRHGANGRALTDRLPPQNIEAEKGVIGSVLLANEVYPDIAAFLEWTDFYRAGHQIIYRAIGELFDRGIACDYITLADELNRCGNFREVGGDAAFTEIIESVPHAANALHYAQIVKQKARSRLMIEIGSAIVRDGYSEQLTAEQKHERAVALLNETAPQPSCGGLERIGDGIDEVWKRYERRAAGEITGLYTGFADLDNVTDGFQPEELIVLGGRPSQGKSALAADICGNVSIGRRLPSLFVSLEMGKRSLRERCVVSRAGVDGQKVKLGEWLNDLERHQVFRAIEEIRDAPLFLVDKVPSHYLNVARVIREAHAKEAIRLAVVDYLQLMTVRGSRENQNEQLDEITQEMKAVARELGITVFLISQLNRAVESRPDKRPLMSDLRGSGSIEQHADIVLLLYRPHYYDKKAPETATEIVVGKNRSGPTGIIKLAFLPNSIHFEDVDYQERIAEAAKKTPF